MEPTYIAIFVIFIVLFIQQRNETAWLKQHLAKKKEDTIDMVELSKRFIGKECIISTFNNQLAGTIREVSDGAILLEGKEGAEAVNLDFVVRIREYPRKKNGKKKSIVVD